MRGTLLSIGLAVVAAAGVVGLLVMRRKPAPAPAPLQFLTLQRTPSNEITLQGTIRAQHVIGVKADVPGLVETFLVEPGQEVYQGQVLARIGAQGLESVREAAAANLERTRELVTRRENELAAARLESSRADADAQRSRLTLERNQKIYERQKMLNAAGATPRLTYEKSLADYEAAQKDYEIMSNAARAGLERVQSLSQDLASARKMVENKTAELDQAQAELSAAEVHSPVDGYVVSRKGEVGKPADDLGEEFFQIATDLYALQVAAGATPDDLKRIVPGMPALVLMLDLQSGAMEGKVREVQDKVIVDFDSGNPAIKPGMQASVRLRFQ
jgi:multidrug resistance efflux pump